MWVKYYGLECFVARLCRYLVWSVLLVRYVGYPLEQVRHISYQLSYAVKVYIRIITNNMCASSLKKRTIKWWESLCHHGLINITMSSGVQFSQKSIGWLGYSEPVGESHPKTRVDVISFHVALCCFPSKWMLCQAPLLCSSFGMDTPLSLLLTTFQRQLCINVPAGAEIFAGTLSFQYDV